MLDIFFFQPKSLNQRPLFGIHRTSCSRLAFWLCVWVVLTMSFDQDPRDFDPHGECAFEIKRLQDEVRRLMVELSKFQVSGSSPVAEVQGNFLVPLPNPLPTPGPGKVCWRCNGKNRVLYIYDRPGGPPGNAGIACPNCQGTGREKP
jgi:hypothetical protein